MPLYFRICRQCGHVGHTLRIHSNKVYRCMTCVTQSRGAGVPRDHADLPELAELESKWYPAEGEVPTKTKTGLATLELQVAEIMGGIRRAHQARREMVMEEERSRKEREFQASKVEFDQLAPLQLELFVRESRSRFLIAACSDRVEQVGYDSYGGYGFDSTEYGMALMPMSATATWQASDLSVIQAALAYQRKRTRFYEDSQPCAMVLCVDTHTGEFRVM